jgi:hypothetical protein
VNDDFRAVRAQDAADTMLVVHAPRAVSALKLVYQYMVSAKGCKFYLSPNQQNLEFYTGGQVLERLVENFAREDIGKLHQSRVANQSHRLFVVATLFTKNVQPKYYRDLHHSDNLSKINM